MAVLAEAVSAVTAELALERLRREQQIAAVAAVARSRERRELAARASSLSNTKTMAKTSTPAPRDLSSEMGSMSQYAAEMAKAQAAAAAELNRQMIADALAATDKISGKLDNSYTKSALSKLDTAGLTYSQMAPYAQQMGLLGGQAMADVGGTDIEEELRKRALADLELGRSLSPEEERAAQQSARAGYAARGMAVGAGSASAEILNRDALATGRESARRNFAGDVNQTLTSNRLQRLGTAGNLLGQTAGIYQNMGAGQAGLSGGYLSADPYQRALGSSIPTASQGPSASLTSNAFGQVLQYGSDLYNTNNNAAWSDYLNGQNMNQATKMGQMQAASAKSAGNSALMGAGIGAAGAIIGGVAIAF
jgi:hypothetical protein